MFRRTLLIVSTLSFAGFILLTFLVDQRSFFFRDFQLIEYAKSFTSSFTITVLTAISWPGYLPQAFFFVSGCLLLLIALGKRLEAAIAAVSFPTIFGLVYIVKTVISRLRPEHQTYLYSGQNLSYPSGHVVTYTVILGFMLYLSSLHFTDRKLKALHAGLYILLMFLIGFSRIYVGHHWPTDIIGGFLLGFSWLTLTILTHHFFSSLSSRPFFCCHSD